jgi:hypothetical protein
MYYETGSKDAPSAAAAARNILMTNNKFYEKKAAD